MHCHAISGYPTYTDKQWENDLSNQTGLTEYEGSCHCQNVRFKAKIDLDDSYVCDCSICSRKGSIMNRVEPGNFVLLTELTDASVYKFNTEVAEHFFCGRCGIHTFHHPRPAPEIFSVNVRCLEGVDLAKLNPKQVFGSKV